MTTSSGPHDAALDAMMQPFREWMTAFQQGVSSTPGWPPQGASSWTGSQGLGAGFSSGPTSSFDPFRSAHDQFYATAQHHWEQLMTQMTQASGGPLEGMGSWRSLLDALHPVAQEMNGETSEAAWREALSTPAVGPMREHVARWQEAALAQMDFNEAAKAFQVHLNEIMARTSKVFEARVAKRMADNAPMTSMRAAFDEWIEAGEHVWAEVAVSEAFVAALGRYNNAQTRLRAASQDQMNRLAESLGLPTKTEVDTDHRRIAELSREVRRLKTELDRLRELVQKQVAAPRPAGKKTVSRAAASRDGNKASASPKLRTAKTRLEKVESMPVSGPLAKPRKAKTVVASKDAVAATVAANKKARVSTVATKAAHVTSKSTKTGKGSRT